MLAGAAAQPPAPVVVVGPALQGRRKETDGRRIFASCVASNPKCVLHLPTLLEADFTLCITHAF
jgi:hypothetical protein